MRSDPFAKQILSIMADAQTALWATYERVDFAFAEQKGEPSRNQGPNNLAIGVEAIIILIKINLTFVDIYILYWFCSEIMIRTISSMDIVWILNKYNQSKSLVIWVSTNK